jgi:Tat protein secretion system quality control protein TatD with DNase activity
MIEKIKDYLYLDNYQEGETEGFSIITVYPYLNFDGNKVEDDENRAIEYSHHSKHCKYLISVRSKEAQDEILSILESFDFPGNPISDCTLNMNEAELRDYKVSIVRKWFQLSAADIIKARDFMVSRSGLGIKTNVPFTRLSEFRKLIHDLRTTRSYRNLWKDEDRFVLG